MASKLSAEDEVIHFTCEHCEILLTVDDSLAGVSGPCPSCGEKTKAPEVLEKMPASKAVSSASDKPKPLSSKSKPVQADSKPKILKKDPPARVNPPVGQAKIKKPKNRTSEELDSERNEVAAVGKILLFGFVLLAVVVVAVWWFRFGPGS